MANLDVALRLRLLNGLSGPSKEARSDLDALRTSAQRLNGVKGGDGLTRDLGRVAQAGGRADASLRRVAADAAGLTATGTAAGRLGTALSGIAVAGSRADATIRRIAAEGTGLSTAGTAAGRLGTQMTAVATAGGRADAAIRGIAGNRAGLAGLDAMAKALATDLDRVAAAGRRATAAQAAMVPRVRGASAADVAPWGPRPLRKTADNETRTRTRSRSDALVTATGGAIGGALGAAALANGYRQSAAFDRRMTMIGQTADAARTQIDALGASVHDLAQETAVPVDKVAGGLEALVAQGRNLKEAMGFLPSVTRTAASSGSQVDDIAKTADSVGSNFGIGEKQMQSAFDIMAAGGKAGQFELKDMARYLPSLSPAAKAQGFKGEQGLADIVAMLQVIRKGSGTAEEAAVSMTNIFQKLSSEESQKNFKKMGVDLEEALKKGRAEGRNLVEVLEEATQKATKGDLSLMPKLFKDQEFGRGMLALMTYRGEWQKLSQTLQTASGGTVVRDLVQVTKDAQASVDRLTNSWQRFIQAASRAADAGGVSAGLGEAGKEFQSIAVALERINQAYAEGGLSSAMKQASGDAAERLRENRKAWLDEHGAREDGRIAELEADNKAFREKLQREGRSPEDIASTMHVREEAVRKARLRRDAIEAARKAPALADRVPLRMGTDPGAPIRGETAPVGIGTVEFNRAYPLDLRRPMTVPTPPARPADVPAWRGVDRIEDVLGPQPAPAPDRFSLDPGTAARADMRAALEAYAARRRASPVPAVRPASTARFDLGGPVMTAPLGIERAPGTATRFPMTESLSRATFDPAPIVQGVKQAEDAAKGLQTTLKQDLSGPAAASMQTYSGALQSGIAAALATVVAAAAQMKAALSFTATPTITPRIVPPAGGGMGGGAGAAPASAGTPAPRAPRQQSAGLRRGGSGGNTFTGPIHVHGVRDVAGLQRGIQREADRRVRDARDNALHDTGPEVA